MGCDEIWPKFAPVLACCVVPGCCSALLLFCEKHSLLLIKSMCKAITVIRPDVYHVQPLCFHSINLGVAMHLCIMRRVWRGSQMNAGARGEVNGTKSLTNTSHFNQNVSCSVCGTYLWPFFLLTFQHSCSTNCMDLTTFLRSCVQREFEALLGKKSKDIQNILLQSYDFGAYSFQITKYPQN